MSKIRDLASEFMGLSFIDKVIYTYLFVGLPVGVGLGLKGYLNVNIPEPKFHSPAGIHAPAEPEENKKESLEKEVNEDGFEPLYKNQLIRSRIETPRKFNIDNKTYVVFLAYDYQKFREACWGLPLEERSKINPELRLIVGQTSTENLEFDPRDYKGDINRYLNRLFDQIIIDSRLDHYPSQKQVWDYSTGEDLFLEKPVKVRVDKELELRIDQLNHRWGDIGIGGLDGTWIRYTLGRVKNE